MVSVVKTHCLQTDAETRPSRDYKTLHYYLRLTAHVAHTAVFKYLISFNCRSYPSWAQYKTYARNSALPRSSNLFLCLPRA